VPEAEVQMALGATVVRNNGLETIISGEFDEMPGMRLTMAQVRHLWNLSRAEAEHIIHVLVGRGALTYDECGRLCRPNDLAS
jgi:hypothetical protein